MIYAIVSDIHANAAAFNAVLDDIESRKVDRKICLGDIVGYCADPNESIAAVKVFDTVLMGNHDYAIHDTVLVEKFNFHARLAIEWTCEKLTPADKEYLANLPLKAEDGELTFVHATPRDPGDWGYIINIDDALDAFNYFSNNICFLGHTHNPLVVTDKGHVLLDKKLHLKDDTRYLVNVGSVGQPRDGDPRACYVIYDSDKRILEFVRVNYNIGQTQSRMIKAKFQPFLIHRLAEGR
ncbi:MAG: metallophosphoesterase family protein [Fibrobacteres bacterium]|nr:metallophosphoesterase family protein [Fibrobacterota bacterium]